MPLVHRDVVVGASAGGVEELRALVRGLPAGFPATGRRYTESVREADAAAEVLRRGLLSGLPGRRTEDP